MGTCRQCSSWFIFVERNFNTSILWSRYKVESKWINGLHTTVVNWRIACRFRASNLHVLLLLGSNNRTDTCWGCYIIFAPRPCVGVTTRWFGGRDPSPWTWQLFAACNSAQGTLLATAYRGVLCRHVPLTEREVNRCRVSVNHTLSILSHWPRRRSRTRRSESDHQWRFRAGPGGGRGTGPQIVARPPNLAVLLTHCGGQKNE